MITDADIKKLEKVFITKQDLMALEKRMDNKFVAKQDLTVMEKRMDNKFATKGDVKELRGDMNMQFADLVEMIAEGFKGVSHEIRRANNELRDELKAEIKELRTDFRDKISNHERRINLLEDKTLS